VFTVEVTASDHRARKFRKLFRLAQSLGVRDLSRQSSFNLFWQTLQEWRIKYSRQDRIDPGCVKRANADTVFSQLCGGMA
jgi:hypothetical protein